MKTRRFALCALCLALLAPLLAHARRILPVDPRPYVAEKYEGWSGVLRLWVCEGWPAGSGSLSSWLNGCVTRFEKRHPGVYVQPQYVDAGAIESLEDSGILPPDLLLLPPGLLNAPTGLMVLELSEALRPSLRVLGTWNGRCYAVPVAMGGYLWAWNAGLTEGIPASWRESALSIAVPEPEEWRRWDAALLALCAGRRASLPDTPEAEVSQPGLDLGLSGTGSDPTPTPRTADGDPLPCRLPKDFEFDGDAWRDFINGNAAAMPVTQREARRLEALSDQGRGPDWRLSAGDAAFTDQLLFLAVTRKPEGDAREGLCLEFLEALLADESQSSLYQASAFSVTDAASGYPPGDPLLLLDGVLRDQDLVAPRCFDGSWQDAVSDIVRKFIEGNGDSPDLWRQLAASLA